MYHFTPFASLLGGALIGLAASVLMLFTGRVAGVTGIAGGLFRPVQGDLSWRLLFIAGLVAGGVVLTLVSPAAFHVGIDRSLGALAVAGLLVGFGARLGSGCTSGHGVCGLSRLSRRSLVATLTFMATGALSVFVVVHLLGGRL
jgi:hypothetical protein